MKRFFIGLGVILMALATMTAFALSGALVAARLIIGPPSYAPAESVDCHCPKCEARK